MRSKWRPTKVFEIFSPLLATAVTTHLSEMIKSKFTFKFEFEMRSNHFYNHFSPTIRSGSGYLYYDESHDEDEEYINPYNPSIMGKSTFAGFFRFRVLEKKELHQELYLCYHQSRKIAAAAGDGTQWFSASIHVDNWWRWRSNQFIFVCWLVWENLETLCVFLILCIPYLTNAQRARRVETTLNYLSNALVCDSWTNLIHGAHGAMQGFVSQLAGSQINQIAHFPFL